MMKRYRLDPNKRTIAAMKAAERGEVTKVGHPRNLLDSLNAGDLVEYRPDPKNPPRLTDEEARRLDSMDDSDIDYSDIPELGDEFFTKACIVTGPRFLTLPDVAADPWNVMRGLLPPDADVPLLLAARDAAHAVLGYIMQAERRDGLNDVTAWLLELAHMSVIGRMAMLDNWRSHLLGAPIVSRPYGEDTDYARAMRLHPAKLAEVIAIVAELADE
jgi:hypothetical protein